MGVSDRNLTSLILFTCNAEFFKIFLIRFKSGIYYYLFLQILLLNRNVLASAHSG